MWKDNAITGRAVWCPPLPLVLCISEVDLQPGAENEGMVVVVHVAAGVHWTWATTVFDTNYSLKGNV